MKLLIIIGFLFILGTFVAIRFRRQLEMAIYFWKMFRKLQQAGEPAKRQIKKQENLTDVSLVKCAKCNAWIPQKKALNLHSKTFYCSTDCVENAVKVG